MKKARNLILTLFTLMLFSVCLSFDSQAAMSDKEVKTRISAYSDSYIKAEKGVTYLEYEKWDASEEKMYEVISNIAESLMGKPVEDYCRVNIKFFFTYEPYGSDFQKFFDELTVVKKKFGNFFTEWSRHNKMTMSVTHYKSGGYFSANFSLYLNGSEQDKYGKEYDDKLLSLVAQADRECADEMEKVQFFLEWLDKNATYLIFTGYTNDPRYALNVGVTVCGGYANAFKDLCNAAGIPAIVPVNMKENHAWSQVYVNGEWYTADLCNVVKSESDTYYGYLFTDPDLSTDCDDFVEKHKKAYVESYKYKDTVRLSLCSFKYKNSYSYSGKDIKPSVTVKYGDTALQKGVHYNVTYKNNEQPGTGKIILEGIGKNGYRGKETLEFKISLPKVSAVTAVPSKTSVRLSWKKAEGVDGYIVRVYNSETDEYEDLDTVKGTSCTVKNLTAGKKYKFAVRTYVKSGGNIYRGSNRTVTVTTVPGKVKGLKIYSVKDTSLKLKWSDTRGAKEYQVQISTDGKKWKTRTTTEKNSCTVKKLSANKKYYFRVRAVNSSGKGSYSSKKSTTTLLLKPEIKVKADKGKITVSWEKIKGAKGYVVAYARNSDMINNTRVTVKKGSKTSATVKGLKSKKNYYVKVRAYKTVNGEKIYGTYSKVVKVRVK
ncbi:MAG: fibronectin type III domain-containing protein [Clostridia bacterium]|nr:fibronectin type III domain-containing protein [Clostridia bacterium]